MGSTIHGTQKIARKEIASPIAQRILLVRSARVTLDRDLAELHGVAIMRVFVFDAIKELMNPSPRREPPGPRIGFIRYRAEKSSSRAGRNRL